MKRQIIFLGLFLALFIVHNLYAKSSIKELEGRLPRAVGKDRVEILSKLVEAYQDIDPKKAIEYGKEALKLPGTFPGPKIEMALLNCMSTAHIWLGNYTASEKYALKSHAISLQINDKIGEANALYNISQTYWNQGRYREARERNSQCNVICEETGDQKGLAKSLQMKAMISWKLGDFSKATKYVHQSISIYDRIGDRRGIADMNNLNGIIIAEGGEYPRSRNYFSGALQIYKTLGEKTGVARTLNNIGFSYSKEGRLSDALKYYSQSLEISRQLEIKYLISTTLNNIGEAYARKEDYQLALKYFAKALKSKESLNDSMWISYTLINIGKIKQKLGRYKEARQLLERALRIAKKINIKDEVRKANKELSAVFSALKDYKKAFFYYSAYMEMDEIIFNEKSQKKMIEIQTLRETDKEENEIALLKKDRQLQQLQLEQHKSFKNSVLIIALLVVLLAFVTYMLYRFKTRTNQILKNEIHEHKQTAQKLRESEEKFRTLAEKSVVGICIIRENVIQYVNPAFLTVFGCTFEEAVGGNILTLVMEEDQPLVMEELNQPLSQDNASSFTRYEFRGITKERKVLHLESYSVQILYQGPAILATIIDITDRKKAEAELLQMRKLESVGTLAGNIAYDFHHLLSCISIDAGKLKRHLQTSSDIFNWVENIEKISIKATRLAQKLTTFAKGGGAELRETTLYSILKSTINTYPQMQRLISSVSISADLRCIYGDERELSQVLSNLLWNAQEARSNSEEVEVSIIAENILLPPLNSASLNSGEYIKITITDNGRGIPSDQLGNVFDPYFSTKETYSQKGMGLGLAICYSIIKKHKGHISIKSEIGKGTAVELLLPSYKN